MEIRFYGDAGYELCKIEMPVPEKTMQKLNNFKKTYHDKIDIIEDSNELLSMYVKCSIVDNLKYIFI